MSEARPNQALLNRIWCQTILEELTRFGVKHVCIAPGSRSTPLTLEAQENAKLTIHTHFDERGLGFLALGLAKAGDEPVAVIVTSGTAVSNLLPAIAESGLTREKLVLLTADRPTELIGCGANQAIDQKGIFSSHVTDTIELPSPNIDISLNWLLTSIDHSMFRQVDEGGAVHINCPFPEPLYTQENKSNLAFYQETVSLWQQSHLTYIQQHQNQILSLKTLELANKRGILVIGNVSSEEASEAKKLAQSLGWPFFCDPQSGITSKWAHYDIWLQNPEAEKMLAQCDFILQVGARIVSKRMNAFVNKMVSSGFAEYAVVQSHTQRLNPNHLIVEVLVGPIAPWLANAYESLKGRVIKYREWGEPLTGWPRRVNELLNTHTTLTELNLAYQLSSIELPTDIFIGNSLIVRLLDMVGSADKKCVYTNRGASGIDGLVATALGVQRFKEQPLLLLIGDTSLLYDINSLALSKCDSQPVVIVVTNNDGGAIFDLLPVPEQQKQSLYQMPHGYDFYHAAAQFGIQYCKPDTIESFAQYMAQHFNSGKGTLLIEVQCPSEEATREIKRLVADINVS